MEKKTHKDRIALISRLEKKYSQKLEKLHKQRQTLSRVRGMHLTGYSRLDYEVTDVTTPSRRLAY